MANVYIQKCGEKQNTKWLLVSHDTLTFIQMVTHEIFMRNFYLMQKEALKLESDAVTFKFEPCIVHVRAKTLEAAQKLV